MLQCGLESSAGFETQCEHYGINTGHSVMVVVLAEGVANVIYAYLESVDTQGINADSQAQVGEWTVRPISVTMGGFNHGFGLNTHTHTQHHRLCGLGHFVLRQRRK